MSQWFVPRLQQQGTRQLTGTKEVCSTKKFLISQENDGSVGRPETDFFLVVARVWLVYFSGIPTGRMPDHRESHVQRGDLEHQKKKKTK